MLRSRLHDLVVEPACSAADVERDVRARVVRRRRRRRTTAASVFLAVLGFGVGVGVVLGGGSADVVTAGDPSPGAATRSAPAPSRPVSVESVDAYGGPTGTERLVVRFDGPLPDDPPTYVADIAHPDAPGVVFTTQPPDGLKVCGTTHWFPGETGTVDLLIPESWLASGAVPEDIPLRELGEVPPAKVVWCGPHRGYVQFGIWGPASDDPANIGAHLDADGTQLVIELTPD